MKCRACEAFTATSRLACAPNSETASKNFGKRRSMSGRLSRTAPRSQSWTAYWPEQGAKRVGEVLNRNVIKGECGGQLMTCMQGG